MEEKARSIIRAYAESSPKIPAHRRVLYKEEIQAILETKGFKKGEVPDVLKNLITEGFLDKINGSAFKIRAA